MDFVGGLKQALRIVQLDGKAALDVAKNRDATLLAFLIAGVGGLAGWIGSPAALKGNIVGAIIGAAVGLVIVTAVIWVMTKLFSGKAGYVDLLRPLGYAMLISWASILGGIPSVGYFVSLAVGIWEIVAAVVIVKTLNGFSTGKAVAVVLIPVVVLIVLAFLVLVPLMIAMGLSAGGLGMMPGKI